MKKLIWVMVVGCLLVFPGLAQSQVDKMIDRFLQKGEQRGEGRIGPRSLSIVQIEFSPDPIRDGQRVAFRVTVLNEARNAGRITLVVRDKDEVITEMRDVLLQPGEDVLPRCPAHDLQIGVGRRTFPRRELGDDAAVLLVDPDL